MIRIMIVSGWLNMNNELVLPRCREDPDGSGHGGGGH